jgi:hypothetical protein
MNTFWKRVLFWAPRGIAILFAVFLSMFALDVFQESRGFWGTLAALGMHLVPVGVYLIILLLAWRWEWVGAVFFAGLAVLYIARLPHQLPTGVRNNWISVIAGPLLVIAALFLLGWWKRGEIRARP